VFRPGSALAFLGVSVAVVVFLLGDALVRAGFGEMMLLAPWPLLALWCVYAAAYASSLAIDDDAITVQNILRTVRIPWRRVVDVQWRWQVEIFTDADTAVRAIGGPLQGRGGARRPGDPSKTPQNVVAQYDAIVRAWEHARTRSGAVEDPVRHGWDVPALVALGVLVVWAVIAVAVTGGPS
jgi:hypothetical protein